MMETSEVRCDQRQEMIYTRELSILTWSNRTTSEKMSPIGSSSLITSVLILKGILVTTCKQNTSPRSNQDLHEVIYFLA